MKLAGALKTYLENDQHAAGKKVGLSTEMAPFLRSLTTQEREAATAELRSYGFDIEDSAA